MDREPPRSLIGKMIWDGFCPPPMFGSMLQGSAWELLPLCTLLIGKFYVKKPL